jgi:hypothetical protein
MGHSLLCRIPNPLPRKSLRQSAKNPHAEPLGHLRHPWDKKCPIGVPSPIPSHPQFFDPQFWPYPLPSSSEVLSQNRWETPPPNGTCRRPPRHIPARCQTTIPASRPQLECFAFPQFRRTQIPPPAYPFQIPVDESPGHLVYTRPSGGNLTPDKAIAVQRNQNRAMPKHHPPPKPTRALAGFVKN